MFRGGKRVCLKCKKPVSDKEGFFCQACCDEALERLKDMDSKADWNLDSIVLFAGIFGWDGRQFSMEELRKVLEEKSGKGVDGTQD